MQQNKLFIDGEWQSGSGPSFQSLNPCTQAAIWSGNAASSKDIDKAIVSARHALPGWSNAGFDARAKIVKAFQSILKDNQQSLAEVIATETGKPLWESLTEVNAMAGKIDLSIDAFHNRTGETTKDLNGVVGRVKHKPHGVIAVFGPYNFPGHLPNGHIVPALLAGNTVAFKPSELTPLVAEKTIELWQQAGLPAGVTNLLQGEKETGIALANHDGIDGIFFTGSSATGAILQQQHAGSGKMLALEMGGNNPLVVHEVNDLDAAVYHIIQSAYLTAGQRCTCARRLIIQEGSDDLIERLSHSIGKIVVDHPHATPTPFMGPVISNQAADSLINAQQQLQQSGGKVLVEMKRTQPDLPFLTPGLVDVTDVTNLPDEEHFGPLLKVIRVKDFAHAIREANNTRFGLAAGLLSDNEDRWTEFEQNIRVGIVNWNRPLTGASGAAPFGGIGASGNFRPSAYYAADYCAYPVATLQQNKLELPDTMPPGLTL
ncbi:succinylglutamate-semialdehyde dehydrogenase [Mariniblastus sp.]|nr:succinylglutamate-semialdehyde dehydrogenase [Mariniblastus sp.]